MNLFAIDVIQHLIKQPITYAHPNNVISLKLVKDVV